MAGEKTWRQGRCEAPLIHLDLSKVERCHLVQFEACWKWTSGEEDVYRAFRIRILLHAAPSSLLDVRP